MQCNIDPFFNFETVFIVYIETECVQQEEKFCRNMAVASIIFLSTHNTGFLFLRVNIILYIVCFSSYLLYINVYIWMSILQDFMFGQLCYNMHLCVLYIFSTKFPSMYNHRDFLP